MTFITAYLKDGHAFSGPDVQAESWDEAKAKAEALGCQVSGLLDSRHFQEPVSYPEPV